MLKYNKKCSTCIAIQEDKSLIDEIFSSKFYMQKKGAPSLQSIADKYGDKFSYQSLKTHVTRHQFMSEAQFTKRHLEQLAKKSEQQVIKRVIESNDVFNTVIQQGMVNLEAGELKVDTKDLLNAAKLKKDFQLKEADQQLAMAQMVYHFASGENDKGKSRAYDRRIIDGEAVEHYDPAAESTADFERRADQSRAFYQSLTGDATPSGTD